MVLKQPEQEMKLMFPQSNNLQTKRQREKGGKMVNIDLWPHADI